MAWKDEGLETKVEQLHVEVEELKSAIKKLTIKKQPSGIIEKAKNMIKGDK